MIALAPGFEEIETITVLDILRRAGARVILGATQSGPIEGSRGLSILSDELIENINPQNFDLIVLPGGQPGTNNLMKNIKVCDVILEMKRLNKYIAAICAAPIILESLEIIKGAKVTSHPSVKDKINQANYLEDRVVVDGNFITSRAPGTAMEFAFKLVELLFDNKRLETVNKGVMSRL